MIRLLRAILIFIGIWLTYLFAVLFWKQYRPSLFLSDFFILKTCVVSLSSALLAVVATRSVYKNRNHAYLFCCFLAAFCIFNALENYYFYSTRGYGQHSIYLHFAILNFFAFTISAFLQYTDKKKAGI